MRKKSTFLTLVICMVLSISAFAANTKTTVSQVIESVSVTTNTDYIITDETPFTVAGSVDIVNTEHAVVIIKKIKPSKVISTWLKYIYINGEKAVNNTNCQVKMYDRGAIIFPYKSSIQPLTCYTEKNFGGTACSDYSEGETGGYMKSLTSANLNNQIHSFKLKRGYMVTFALGVAGWGYSRCFIADQEDLEVNLPANMAGRVSSYRIFKWVNAHKGGVANTTESGLLGRLDVSWCYAFSNGESRFPDYECVPHHIHEDWPTSVECGQVNYSCHLKTNNEPGNPDDPTPQSVEVVLDHWQNLMRTGLRLCSESSHDGSMSHLRAFIDAVDARGWRCDILDLHCYWADKFDKMQSYYTEYGSRPIWISEWVWGASWSGGSGIFSVAPDGKNSYSVANQQACYNGTVPVLKTLNASKYVERYAYWNSEADCSKLDRNGSVSLLGEYYAKMDDGLGYDASIQKIPTVVYTASSNLTAKLDTESNTVQLNWIDSNGDMLDSMAVMCKRSGSTQYEYVASIPLKDVNSKFGASYSFVDTPQNGTNIYCIAVYPIGNKTPKYSNTATNLVISQEAVWNDVTSAYVTNPNFDTSSDFQTASVVNGATTANHKKATGWTTTCTSDLGSSAVFKIGSSYTLNGKTPPNKDAEGNASGGALGISQGWSGENYYTQKVTLPAGTYRFSYAVYNVANAGSFVNLCGYKVGSQAAVYDNITSLATGTWRISTLSAFTLLKETEVTLSLGFIAANSLSTSNPYLFFDYVKIEEADLSNVGDGGKEIVWMDVEDDIIKNSKFDIEADFLTANIATSSAANNKNVTSWKIATLAGWGCAGVMKVGSGRTLNGQAVPTLNADGKAAGGVLSINQGWSGENCYTQTVTLPAGSYRLSYAVYNAENPTASFTSRCGYKIGTKAAVYDALSPLSTGSWHTKMMEEFTLDTQSSVTLSLGYVAAGSTSSTNPFLFFDYIKLEKAVVKSIGGVTSISAPSEDDSLEPAAIYDINGIRIPALQEGVNIVKYKDGSSEKILK